MNSLTYSFLSEYSSGSEWRRWDLHIHTPKTNKNDMYDGLDEEKWDNFYKSISDYIGDGRDPVRAISVIGITDYVTIDNYKKVVDDKRLPSCVKLIIPNIEMRMTPVATKSPVNIHFLFDPSIVDQLERRFFNQLKIDIGGRIYHPVREDLIELGMTQLPNETDEDVLFKAGVGLFVISKDAIDAVMKSDPDLRNHVLIGVSNGSNDGLSGVGKDDMYQLASGSQMSAVVDSIFKMCDFIFSGKENDIAYFLGKKNGKNCSKQDVINRCGSLMPCIIGSDAHSNERLFEPDKKRYCWIKADPTFNGLRQIKYEPEMRVKIQECQPENKESYYVIDGVSLGGAVDKEKYLFSNNFIPFNANLNCIIGGKSTGKSLLLRNIATAIDPVQVNKKCENQNHQLNTNTYLFDAGTVRWKDGAFSKSTDDIHSHKIVYIPQSYLNRLSESEDESTDIDDIIQSIVLSNKENNDAFVAMKLDLDSLKEKTDSDIYQLLSLKKELDHLRELQKDIGTGDGIRKEIEAKEKRINEISKTLSISEEDVKKYYNAQQDLVDLDNSILKLTAIKNDIERINNVISICDFSKLNLSSDIQRLFNFACDKAFQAANESWKESKAGLLKELNMQISKCQNKMQVDKGIIDSLFEQVNQSAELVELSDLLKKQKEKLDLYLELDLKISENNSNFSNVINRLSKTFNNYKAIHEKFANHINNLKGVTNNKSESDLLGNNELHFIVKTPFRREILEEKLRNSFNKTVLKGQRNIIDLDSFDENDFTPEKIEIIIKSIMNGSLKLRSFVQEEEFLRVLLSDWFNTTYNVEMGGDTIGVMSPGKKALVLLKMLIELEGSRCPILIDQPEDDLDNRSIYNELIPFIISKKVERQIIVVTHNANVVLGADAEEVIVANQNGQNVPNNAYKFEYVSGSIEHSKDQIKNSNVIKGVLYKSSIQQHICDILEGGEQAFKQREEKYRLG